MSRLRGSGRTGRGARAGGGGRAGGGVHPARGPLRTGKVMNAAAAARLVRRLGRRGAVVVFTNGCFDLLHAGHVDLLERARALGDALVVGVNTDRSVRRLKGAGRPIVPLRERMEILAALRAVDAVVPFAAATPARLVRRLRPRILVKGADYRDRLIVGRDTVERDGGRVVTLPLRPGRSTSALIERILQDARRARRQTARSPRGVSQRPAARRTVMRHRGTRRW